VAGIQCAGIIVITSDSNMRAAYGWITPIGSAIVTIITANWWKDAAGLWIAVISGTGIIIIAGNRRKNTS